MTVNTDTRGNMLAESLPVLTDNPFSPENMADPLPFHEKLRNAGPLVYMEELGTVATGRYDLAVEILHNWQDLISSRGVGLADLADPANQVRPPSPLLETDPPAHDYNRTIADRLFAPKFVRALKSKAQESASGIVSAALSRGVFDGFEDLAYQFVMSVVPDAIGIPEEGRENAFPFSFLALQAIGSSSPRVLEAFAEADELRAWADRCAQRENVAEGGMGAMLWAAVDSGEIDADHAKRFIQGLLTAGFDSTMYSIVNVLHSLATNPEQWDKLRGNPGLAKFAFNEALRFMSVVQWNVRTAGKDVELGGVLIPEGTKVMIFTGAANRDPRHWGDRAEVYDITSAAEGHLGFGLGIHVCAGQPLARMEGEKIIGELASQATGRLQLAGVPDPLLFPGLRSSTKLPLQFV